MDDDNLLPMIDSTFKNASILIIDNKEANIGILTALLEGQGYTNIRSSTDSRRTIDLYMSFNPDLILLDLMMPHPDGFEVMEQLKAIIPEGIYLPILVLTADISPDVRQRALSGGARDFLAKPFDLAEVGLRIRNLLFARYLHQQLIIHNQELEARVRERTAELENANVDLIDARNRAQESDFLKTAFLNNISHEIRTPFNGILGFLSMIQDDELLPADRDYYIRIINESADRLMNAINHIVEISQILAGQMALSLSETSLSKLSDELITRFRPDAESKNLQFNFQNLLPTQFDLIYTDTLKLRSILFNLIENAVKFTASGFIEVTITGNHDSLDFTIRDSGMGIPKNKFLTIFDRFMQADVSNTRRFEGTGLGLAIAKAHVEMLRGRIWLESQVGMGTTFFVHLPREPFKHSRHTPGTEPPVVIQGSKPMVKILVAEDDDVNFDYVKVILAKAGFKVVRAQTGLEAIEICRSNPDLALILMDIKMPNMDGYLATAEIREFNPVIPIIAITAYALPGDNKKAFSAGCSGYLAKPVRKEELIAIIRTYTAPEF